MINSNDNVRTRILIPAMLWIPISLALITRFYVVQIKNHEYYQEKVDRSCNTQIRKERKWGEIRDRDGYLLVGNKPCVRISCSPHELKPEKRTVAAELLHKYLGESVEHYYNRLNPTRPAPNGQEGTVPNKFQMLCRDASIDTAHKLKEELKANNIPLGIFSFEDTYTRDYPKKRMLANFIGYSNMENDELKPQAGIEKGMSADTAPHSGKIRMEISRDGVPLDYGKQNISAGRDGKNIYLTISEPIQSILEEELDAAWKEWNPEAIYAAIATPDGQILAIAQRPTFDPSDRSTFNSDTLRNRLIMDGFEPGSVMKPFTVAKALDWGVVTPDSRVDCEGGRWTYYGKRMTDTHHNEKLTVSEVIQKSSNIGTAKIALMLGEKRLYEALSGFGFGFRTGIPLPYESAGDKPRPRRNDRIAVTRIPIGYASKVTVLQLLRAYCTLANGGRRPQLRLIDRVEDPATGKSDPFPAAEAEQVIEHPAALEQLIDMMISVTRKGGTATPAAIPGYDVAGKTGTSNKYIIEYEEGEPAPGKKRKIKRRYYSKSQYYASFAGFVPARNPQFVMVVTIDTPRGKSHFGGTVSGPIFARTAKRVLDLLNVPPDHPEELEPKKPERKRYAARSDTVAPRKTSRPAPTAPAQVRRSSRKPSAAPTTRRSRQTTMRSGRPSPKPQTDSIATRKSRSSGGPAPTDLPRMTQTWKQEWP